MICVDKEIHPGMDMLDDGVMAYLVQLVLTGRVKAFVGGPPCRTVSACRYAEPGPRPVRSEQYPFGFPDLTSQEKAMVEGDTVMFLRMLFLYGLSEEMREEEEERNSLLVEQPQDPATYRSKEEVEEKKFMSWWRLQVWQDYMKLYEVEMLHCDQGPMGHARRKPTSLAYEASVEAKCKLSQTWAAWAPGLKAALVVSLRRRLQGQQFVRALTVAQKNAWKMHFENDHMPARRDCRTCLEAAGRSKPHHRVRHPQAFTLSVDVTGPFVKGIICSLGPIHSR